MVGMVEATHGDPKGEHALSCQTGEVQRQLPPARRMWEDLGIQVPSEDAAWSPVIRTTPEISYTYTHAHIYTFYIYI